MPKAYRFWSKRQKELFGPKRIHYNRIQNRVCQNCANDNHIDHDRWGCTGKALKDLSKGKNYSTPYFEECGCLKPGNTVRDPN